MELMVVVAIVGILASLSSYGVRKYTAASKSAEAVNTLGAIGMAVRIAADRDFTSGKVLELSATSTSEAGTTTSGSTSGSGNSNGKGQGQGNGATVTHGVAKGLCGNSEPVPASLNSVKARKYQPTPSDYKSGDARTGWRCLLFSFEQPQYYQYSYRGGGGGAVSVELPHGGNPKGLSKDHEWMAIAKGDLDGDGVTSSFALQGYVDTTGELYTAPAIASERATE